MGLRDEINKRPWLGWACAAALLGLSAYLFWRLSGGTDPYDPSRITEEVTIKFTDTGEEITMPRGRLERELRYRQGKLDPTKGIVNPKTGQPTGFLFSKSDWESTISRLNEEKDIMSGGAPVPAPKK